MVLLERCLNIEYNIIRKVHLGLGKTGLNSEVVLISGGLNRHLLYIILI